MDEQRAIEILNVLMPRYVEQKGECKVFSCIAYGTDEAQAILLAISALEKQIPKKAIPDKLLEEGAYIKWRCPNCGEMMWSGFYFPPLSFSEFCKDCGQAIDWSE